jgi:predicted enzyme related to lactoylglutathione lyase
MRRLYVVCAAAIALGLNACAGASNSARDKGMPAIKNEASTMTSKSMPVTWFSLPSDDLERATTFYNRAFGWKVEPITKEANEVYDFNVVVNSPSDGEYVPYQAGRVNGCIVKRAIGLTTPAVLIEVDDLDEAGKKVVAAGGTIVSGVVAMKSLNGEFILVKDPDGNLLELFRSVAP